MKELTIKNLLNDYALIIPEIQREYVWGSNKDVVDKFLSELNASIKDSADSNIGFLYSYKPYGADNDENFIIDGQQRLTTIVLLAYYYAVRDNKEAEFRSLLKTTNPLMSFSYRVRPLTEQFLINLFNDKKISVEKLEHLKDAKWYVSDYDSDMTIKSICELYKYICDKNLFENLNYDSLVNQVKFYYFDVKQTSQGEELYITMNSRGEKLKDNEQIKPYILDNILDKGERHKAAKEWDEWEEYFFEKLTQKNDKDVSKIDTAIENIIKIALELYGKKIIKETSREKWQYIEDINAVNDSQRISFEHIQTVYNHVEKLLGGRDKNKATVPPEIQSSGFLNFMFDKNTGNPGKTRYLLETLIIALDIGYEINDKNIARLIRLVNNSCAYGVMNHVPLLRFLDRLKKMKNNKPKNIYEYIIKCDELDSSYIDGVFKKNDKHEEIDKMQQIINGQHRGDGKSWEEIITEAENYAFFNSEIKFLFTDGDGTINWESFDTKWENIQKYFDESGVSEEYRKNAVLLRSFISKWDDWSQFWGIPFDNTCDTWKFYLTSIAFLKPINYLLKNLININKIFTNYNSKFDDKLCMEVQNDLVKTSILTQIADWQVRLHWKYGNYILYPYNEKNEFFKIIIAHNRNKILSELYGGKIEDAKNDDKVYSNQKYEKCDFFWGYDICFTYNNNKYIWTWDNYIKRVDKATKGKQFDGTLFDEFKAFLKKNF